MAFSGDLTPVLAEHSNSFSLIDCIAVGPDQMHATELDTANTTNQYWQLTIRKTCADHARRNGLRVIWPVHRPHSGKSA
jgi:hypothetical protein